jgi:hypothetical protein
MKNLRTMAVLFISLSFLLASTGLAVSGETYSGFIENYPAFKADKDQKGAKIYRKPGIKLKTYSKIMIDPIEIWYANDSKYKGISPDDMKALADTFRAAIVGALEPDYPVVSKPGAGVLGIRMAITNVYAKKKKRGLLGYTPVGIVAIAAKKIAKGQSLSLVNATIEVEMLDSESNERLGVLIDSGPHSYKHQNKKLTSWEEIDSVLKFYASRFRTRMDMEHSK